MNRDGRVDELLAPMRGDLPDAQGAPAIDRERIVARMMDVAKSEPRASRRWVVVFAVAAAFAVGFGAMRWARKPAPTEGALAIAAVAGEVTWRGAGARAISPGQSANVQAEGSVTTASSGEAHVRSPSGLEVDLFGDTHVGLDALRGSSQSLRLFGGKVRCRVPHLAASETFSVETSDVRVIVHGTVFSVEASRDGAITVRVDEGVVSVHHPGGDVTLKASESWTNARPSEPTNVAAEPTVQEGREAPPKASISSTRKPSEPSAPATTLDEETRLVRSGLAAERSGDLARAASAFDQLLSRFPQSPLAPDARAALARVRSHQRSTP